MPLESRATSVLSPDERMWRRGLIKQMTKRAGLGQEKRQALHFFLCRMLREKQSHSHKCCFRGLGRQGVCGGGEGVVWSQFEMHGKAAG